MRAREQLGGPQLVSDVNKWYNNSQAASRIVLVKELRVRERLRLQELQLGSVKQGLVTISRRRRGSANNSRPNAIVIAVCRKKGAHERQPTGLKCLKRVQRICVER